MSLNKGPLKFKGGDTISKGGVKKKKKRKSGELALLDEAAGGASGSAGPKVTEEGVYLEPPPEGVDRRTAAEKKYDEHLLKREQERVAKMAQKSHREKVAEFNAYLENLSEHHDIPKVGPG